MFVAVDMKCQRHTTISHVIIFCRPHYPKFRVIVFIGPALGMNNAMLVYSEPLRQKADSGQTRITF